MKCTVKATPIVSLFPCITYVENIIMDMKMGAGTGQRVDDRHAVGSSKPG